MKRTLLAVTMATCLGLPACEDITEPAVSRQGAVLPAQGASGITVMTRNVYLGFDIDAVLGGAVPFEEGFAELYATNFPQRAQALADEIQATKPHLIGLQEIIKYRMQVPSDIMLGNFTPNATEPVFDFLAILMDALDERGLEYDIVANNPTTDVEVPMQVAPGVWGDVRYTDHDVILARADVQLGDVTEHIYSAAIPIALPTPLPATTRPLGFVAVEAVANGRPMLFVSTHLETQNASTVQVAQTAELIDWMSAQDLPIILVGDLNSAANASAPASRKTETYGMLLDAGFHDVWLRGHPGNEGLTCCHATDLLTDRPFDQRLDLILLNNGADSIAGGVQTAIVGVNPFQAGQPKWASDHAGLVATLRLPVGPQQ